MIESAHPIRNRPRSGRSEPDVSGITLTDAGKIPPEFGRNRRIAAAVLFVLVAAAACVRLAMIPRSNLWADEIFSLAVATGHSLEHPARQADPAQGDFLEVDTPQSPARFREYLEHREPAAGWAGVIRAVTLSDTSPPLYYLLLYGWTRLVGASDWAVRLFSVAWIVASLPLLWSLARRTGGGRAVYGTVAFFAFAPISVYYSVEARMYSLLWFSTCALMLSALLLHQKGANLWRVAAWIAAAAGGLLTHYFFVFPLGAAVAFLVLSPGRLRRGYIALVVVAAALLVSPWYARLPEQFANWRITAGWLESPPYKFDRLTSTRDFVLHFFSGESFYLWKLHKKANATAYALFGLIALVSVLCLRRRLLQPPRLLLWLWFGSGCAGPVLLDLVQGTYMVAVPRYASTALPAAYLLVGTGLGCFGVRARTAIVALIVAAWVPTLGSIFQKRSRSGPDLRGVAEAIAAQSTGTDLVLIHSIPSGVIGFARYYDGPAPIASWVEQLGERRAPESLRSLAAGRTAIHFFRFHEVGAPAPEEDWLRVNAVVARETRVAGSLVTEFRPKAGETF
jgi:hypothetical protein